MKIINWITQPLCIVGILALGAGCSDGLEEEDVLLQRYIAPTEGEDGGFAVEVNLGDNTFEDRSVGNWQGGGSATVEVSEEQVHAGFYSLKVASRASATDGATLSFDDNLIYGNAYTVSAFIKLADSSDTMSIVVNYADDNGEQSVVVAEGAASSSQWVKLIGQFTYLPEGEVTSAPYFTIVGAQNSSNYYIDTVAVADKGSTLGAPVNKMSLDVTSGWRVNPGELALSYTDDGVSFAPVAADDQLLYDVTGPLDLSASDIIISFSVDQTFIDSGADLQVIAQDKQTWTGEWGCYIANDALPAAGAEQEYTCSLNNDAYNLADGASEMQLGLQAKGTPAGNVTIHSVEIPLPSTGGFVLNNAGLEDGSTDGWVNQGGSIAVTSADAYEGTYSLHMTNRTAGWNGAGMSLGQQMLEGETYQISIWVKLSNTDSADLKISLKYTDADGDHYPGVADAVTVTNTEWTQISGSYTHQPNGGLAADPYFYVEGPADVEFYLDSAAVTGAVGGDDANLGLANTDLEQGTTDGWVNQGGTMAVATEESYQGDYSLHMFDRSANWNGAGLSMAQTLTAGSVYTISVWVKMENVDSAPIGITMKLSYDGSDDYVSFASGTATNGDWTQISGQYTHEPSADLVSDPYFYVESSDATANYYLDAVTIVENE